jgi:hypothetical protein
MNRFVKPAATPIMATCPGYIPVIRRIDVRADSAQLFSYVMEQTQMLRDSIFAVRKALSPQTAGCAQPASGHCRRGLCSVRRNF